MHYLAEQIHSVNRPDMYIRSRLSGQDIIFVAELDMTTDLIDLFSTMAIKNAKTLLL